MWSWLHLYPSGCLSQLREGWAPQLLQSLDARYSGWITMSSTTGCAALMMGPQAMAAEMDAAIVAAAEQSGCTLLTRIW